MPRYVNRVAKTPTSFRFPAPVWEMLKILDVELRTYNITQCVVRLITDEWDRRHGTALPNTPVRADQQAANPGLIASSKELGDSDIKRRKAPNPKTTAQ